ncbi:jg13354 [Pararge aegeria aegeria]|uniref:Jg13354 protein n=1 Tax=Pararge aegeria aegeria TaxID=348720 RepID=A0A8S4QHW1_9NEOP|nr:jg13354 [Pararge aegeria aegeria]
MVSGTPSPKNRARFARNTSSMGHPMSIFFFFCLRLRFAWSLFDRCHVDRLRSIVTPLSRSPIKHWSPPIAALSLLEEV